ncbi:WcaF family extracellular polysaccharide biosynthesis acetyltransferase [Pontibacter silvestris]|uniref:WcaF family extracellular polysaccharide biosynthesis acetyltransferase n=1 Tax=Pontibacter silvestris TaxID=2305183 RepID=A0ABW4WXC2_9BACT|nr:WcaF family extracellular polysaccharide biosynthesis acetyltransferase [Pontibacter silvestris]MCC9137327.1 WcaF family extracellular polysaccharide biosynthesis acetyltransferase [Pontibacter silvestris]
MIAEEQNKVKLNAYNNDWYKPGAGTFKRTLWYFVNVLFFINPLNPVSFVKVWLLRLFGAKVGAGVVIKPNVNIKYPWLLHIGNHVWIGEEVWIDNLTKTVICDNVSLSQGAMLLTGSHNYKTSTFDLIIGEIKLQEGTWIGAKAIVCPGVTCGSHSVLAAGSVATQNLAPYTIYQGNPALPKRKRNLMID